MTQQEAIQMLERMLDPDPWKDYGLSDKAKEALEMGIEALEKQIPQKPIKSKVPRYGMGYEYYDWVCPTCGNFLAPEPQRRGNHHCVCGQVIDWSEDK